MSFIAANHPSLFFLNFLFFNMLQVSGKVYFLFFLGVRHLLVLYYFTLWKLVKRYPACQGIWFFISAGLTSCVMQCIAPSKSVLLK